MDAILASLEAKVGQVQADTKVKANQLMADLKKQRDVFEANVKKQGRKQPRPLGRVTRRNWILS